MRTKDLASKLSVFASTLLPCLFLTITASTQQPWQHLQMPTAAEVRTEWQSPPPEYGPEPYYGLNGPVTIDTVRHDLDTMHELGYQAVTVQYGYGASFEYLSPEYFDFFKQFVAEAKKRGMRVWIVDDAGYPSGFAGGKFTTEHPELRMQALVVSERIVVEAGQPLERAVSPDAIVVGVAPQHGFSTSGPLTCCIPIVDHQISFKAPAGMGPWTLTIVEHRFMTSPTRSDTNPKRVKDGSQSLEDYLDPAATAQYLAFTHEQYKKAVGEEFGKTIMGFRGDEPDYSISGLPWTPNFFKRFQQIKGYTIQPYLPLLAPTARVPGQTQTPPFTSDFPFTAEEQRRAKADYYDVFSQMFRDGFFKPQGEWCAANHLEYQVHLNHEEMEMQLVRSEGSFFRDMQYVEVPGIDSIWHQIWTDTISDFPRLASSVAHVYGHPRAFTESFAAYRPQPDLPMVKYILDEQFVRGVNLVETMYYPATSTPNRAGPAKYMQDPGYPALLAYVRRMSYLMSMGRPDANVALYLPSASMWLGDAAVDTQFVSAERLLSEHQIDFDIVDEDFLRSPQMTTLSGNAYRTVILPGAEVLSEVAFNSLQKFVGSGGKVLILGDTPTIIADKAILNGSVANPTDFSWATVLPVTLPETPTPPAQPPTTPPAAMVVTAEVLTVLNSTIAPQDATLDTPDTAIRLMHRELKDAEVYLFFNESATASSHRVSFATKPKRIEVWDPTTGAVTSLPSATAPLQLKAYETRVFVVR